VLQYQRDAEIVRQLRVGGPMSVATLAGELAVSASTIRRDLDRLAAGGTLRRVRGGAVALAEPDDWRPGFGVDTALEEPFDRISTVEVAAKDAVGRRAADLVADGDVVLLDIGTTTQALARHLRGRRLTVMTTSLAVLDVLRDDPAVQLILLGGMVRRNYLSLVGTITEDVLRQVRATRTFLGTSGIGPGGEVMDTTVVEVPVKRAMIEAASEVVVLADATKFPGTGVQQVCGPERVHRLITTRGAPTATLAACTAAGIEVVVA
jgi:DeoR/GlpR family transcriptional regulator of sugar metabolism